MNFLSVESLSKTFGTKTLFKDLTFGINKGQRVGLIARNGAGKSTLLNILLGKESPDTGIVSLRKDITVTFLDQNPEFDPSLTVFETVYHADSPILKTVKKYEEALMLFEKNHSAQHTDMLQEAGAEMDNMNAWDYETKIKEILSRLNINFLDRKVGNLSGGQKKRLALASVLIHQPDLLVLDEPTNHLDVEMIEWLEQYLVGRDLTLLLVTHDRYFLDRICNEIIELDNGKLYTYKGDFSYYLEKKAEREIAEASEMDKARNMYRRELEWVRKMPKARGTKSKARLDSFDELEAKVRSKRKEEKMELQVKTERLGGKILELIRLTKSYGEQPILKTFSYIFKKNDKIGIVGKNGIGKSTFLNMIMELEPYDSGKITTGESVVFGYYSQDGLILNEDKRVIEVVKEFAEFIPLADGTKLSASQLLQKFMFPPDVQYNYVSKLSGGEKRRLYLLTILIKNPNFLILDEPTNDLDIMTLSILEDFLESFTGCILIVSHDRFFMDRLVNHLFVFEGDGIISDFPGNYSEYRDKKIAEEESLKEKTKEEKLLKEKPVYTAPTNTSEPKRKISYKEKQEYETLEKEIMDLEEEKKELSKKLSMDSSDHEKIVEWSTRFSELEKLIDQKSIRWLELAELL